MKVPVKIYEGDNSFEHRMDTDCHKAWDYHCMVSRSFIKKYERIMKEYNDLMVELKEIRKTEIEPT